MTQYFAKAPTSEIANEISGKWSEHEQWLSSSGYGRTAQTMYNLYYGLSDGGFEVSLSSDGSSAKLSVNHFKSLIQRLHSITTQAKLQFVPRARNSDADSQMQADFARGLLDAYNDDKAMSQFTSGMVELGLVCLDSYIYAPWDEHQGEIIAAGEGIQELRNGDQAFHVLTRFDVAQHPTLDKSPYYIVKILTNKHDLAALYPAHSEEILKLSTASNHTSDSELVTPFTRAELNDNDTVAVYHFLHDRTPSLPKGRYSVVVGQTVLKDTVLPYKTLPVVKFSGGKMQGTNVGDSPGTMLVGIQQAIDNIYSSNLSNNLHFNKQSIWSPTDIEIEKLSEGYNHIKSAQMPQALQLTASSAESYKLLQGLENVAQVLSGVNATTRGQPEASLKSGNSLALMLSISVMSADSIQKNYVQAASDLATIVIHNLQQFASEPRIAYIGGVSRKSYAKEFKSSDIAAIDRVSIDVGNPIMSSLAGRYELVQQMMQFGNLKDPGKIIEFLRTGQVDSLTEDAFKDTILIRNENEAIRKGEVPPVAIFDLHPQHILEHKGLANDPATRNNPVVMQALLAHIQEHILQMKNMDPDMAAILSIPPLPSQSMPPQAPNEAPEALGQRLPNLPPGSPMMAQDAYSTATGIPLPNIEG